MSVALDLPSLARVRVVNPAAAAAAAAEAAAGATTAGAAASGGAADGSASAASADAAVTGYDPEANAHDAGYDAYMTGVVFLRSAALIASADTDKLPPFKPEEAVAVKPEAAAGAASSAPAEAAAATAPASPAPAPAPAPPPPDLLLPPIDEGALARLLRTLMPAVPTSASAGAGAASAGAGAGSPAASEASPEAAAAVEAAELLSLSAAAEGRRGFDEALAAARLRAVANALFLMEATDPYKTFWLDDAAALADAGLARATVLSAGLDLTSSGGGPGAPAASPAASLPASVTASTVPAALARNRMLAQRRVADRSCLLHIDGLNPCVTRDDLQAMVASAAGISPKLIDRMKSIVTVGDGAAFVLLPSPFHVMAVVDSLASSREGSAGAGAGSSAGGHGHGASASGSGSESSTSSASSDSEGSEEAAGASAAGAAAGGGISGVAASVRNWWARLWRSRGSGSGDNMLGFPGVSHRAVVRDRVPAAAAASTAASTGASAADAADAADPAAEAPAAKRRAVAAGADGDTPAVAAAAPAAAAAAANPVAATRGGMTAEAAAIIAALPAEVRSIAGALSAARLTDAGIRVETYESYLRRFSHIFGDGGSWSQSWPHFAPRFGVSFFPICSARRINVARCVSSGSFIMLIMHRFLFPFVPSAECFHEAVPRLPGAPRTNA